MFATLVVEIPVAKHYYGGELVVNHNGKSKVFKSNNSVTPFWVAFFASCQHQINKVSWGYVNILWVTGTPDVIFRARCTLVYNLKRTGQELEAKNESWDARFVALVDKAFEFGDQENYGANFTIGHLMDYQYAVSNIVPSVLKVRNLLAISTRTDYNRSTQN
jgi:hypothetical protein